MRVGINGFVVFDYRPRLGFVLNFSFGAHFRHYFVKIIKSDPGYLNIVMSIGGTRARSIFDRMGN